MQFTSSNGTAKVGVLVVDLRTGLSPYIRFCSGWIASEASNAGQFELRFQLAQYSPTVSHKNVIQRLP